MGTTFYSPKVAAIFAAGICLAAHVSAEGRSGDEVKSAVEKALPLSTEVNLLAPDSCDSEAAPPRAASSPARKQKPNTLPSGRGSYSELIKQGAPVIPKHLGESCVNFLKTVYESGKTLKSSAVWEASKPVKSYPFLSGGAPLDFYHYTDSAEAAAQFSPHIKDRQAAHKKALKDDDYGKMQHYLRTAGRASSVWIPGLYVAEDSESSRGYGKHQVRLILAQDARVLNPPDHLWAAVKKELSTAIPGLKEACFGRFHVLSDLIMEDSGIDLLDYDSGTRRERQWFILLRTEKLRQTEVH